MPEYKLYYFNAAGRGETARWLFEVAGIKYEDIRFKMAEWQAEYKAKSPFGKCPWLEVDGRPVAFASAINRYIAKQAGLAGSDDFEMAKVDMVAGYTDDMQNEMGSFRFERDPAVKETKKQKLLGETLPRFFGNFEKLLVQNNGGDGYFVGEKITWCDMQFAFVCNAIHSQLGDAPFEAFPKVRGLRARVMSQPQIEAWIKRRPEDDM